MQDNLDQTSLDDLFREARRALHGQTVGVAKAKAATPVTPEDPYHSSAWVKTRGVALVHEETRTVLGNFTEYTNRFIPGARRLVRELEVSEVRVVEYVTGTWGEPTVEPVRGTKIIGAWRLCTINVELPCMGVQVRSVELKAYFGDGTLERVELTQDTTFAGLSNEGYFNLICIPAGANIFSQMSQPSINLLLTTLGQPT
jgi:hypothetical protein